MADQTTQHMVVAASPQRTWEVLTDFEGYPNWAHDLKTAEIVERDEAGRARDVAFRAAAMGRSTSYTLRYDYSQAPNVLAWKLLRGDITPSTAIRAAPTSPTTWRSTCSYPCPASSSAVPRAGC
jgi:uncharacterized protein YndB with AHSA1/START domain